MSLDIVAILVALAAGYSTVFLGCFAFMNAHLLRVLNGDERVVFAAFWPVTLPVVLAVYAVAWLCFCSMRAFRWCRRVLASVKRTPTAGDVESGVQSAFFEQAGEVSPEQPDLGPHRTPRCGACGRSYQ